MGSNSTSTDFSQTFSPQFERWFMSLIEAPYSALVSNVLLILLAIILIATGMIARWIAMHPARVHNRVVEFREYPRVRQAEGWLRRVLTFLLRRFDPVGAYGLSFTTALVALFLGVWFFGSIIEDLVAYNGTALFDVPVAEFVAAHRVAWLTFLMKAASLLGSGPAVVLLGLGAAIAVLHRERRGRFFSLCLAVLAGAVMLDWSLGALILRPRPPADWMISTTADGFLLGQVTVSVLYGLVASFIAVTRTTWPGKVLIWTAAFGAAFLVGVSRIYLGTDWLTDVLSRWALALVWLSATLIIVAVVEEPSASGAVPPLRVPVPDRVATAVPSLEPPSFHSIQYPATPIDGLSQAEVTERRSRGLVNIVRERTSRPIADILKANVFTRFNAVLGGLFVVILLVSGKQDALFGVVLIANTAIGIIQEFRAKRTLDRLRLLVAPRIRVIRDGTVHAVPTVEIVIDDVLELRPGDQVPVDGVLLVAENLETNESLLTGEAEPVTKFRGDTVLSGSLVVAGYGLLQAVQIGEASYARRLAQVARKYTPSQSPLRHGINEILRYVTWALFPTAGVLFITQLLFSPAGAQDAAVSSIAGIVGMVPEGLVLLTSTVMAAAVVRLAANGALIQDLAGVELLARVDVLCTDKTGTLTEGTFKLEEIIPLNLPQGRDSSRSSELRGVLGAFAHEEGAATASTVALRNACARPTEPEWNVVGSVSFSSARKWSALTFADHGTWALGAPEIVLRDVDQSAELLASVDELAEKGKRVLALARCTTPAGTETLALPSVDPAALIVLGETVRTDAAETIRYFEDHGVAIKVISGDHVATVKAVSTLAGVHSDREAFDARALPSDGAELGIVLQRYSLFGRVTPAQKPRMVQALRADGHVVAMIGDGINDVLAIKESDFGIALASGTGASRAVAQLILLKDSFAALPAVLAEGRRVIANVERTANLFITKTVYVFCLALAIGIAQAPFPFLPRHLTLVSFVTIGIPGLFLSLAPNTAIARLGFVPRVLRFAVPAGTIAAAATLLSYAATRIAAPGDVALARSAATLALVGYGLVVLWLLARPRNVWHWLFLMALPAVVAAIMATDQLRDFFALQLPPLPIWGIVVAIVAVAAAILFATGYSDVALQRRGRKR